MSFSGLTADHCAEALAIARPTIEFSMKNVAKREHGNLVVSNPRIPYEPKYKGWSIDPEDPFEDLVLFEHQWGDLDLWASPYKHVSRSKLYASWKTGLSTRMIQQMAPWLYEELWTKWPGSVVELGLVVSFSGVEDYFDEMFSGVYLAALKGVLLREILGAKGVMANPEIMFLGE